jgi:hypothetical protein
MAGSLAINSHANLIALWEFDEGSGISANSSVGSYTASLINFADTTAGAGDGVGNSGWTSDGRINFNGPAGATTTPRIETSFPMSDLIGSSFTVEYRASHNSANGNWSPVIGQSGSCCFFVGKTSGSETLRTHLQGLIEGADAIDSVPINYSNGDMHHIAVVFDENADTVTQYFNKVMVGQATSVTGTLADRGNLWFGNVGHAISSEAHDGFIDAVAISNTVLSPNSFVLIPEPSALSLIGVGLAAIFASRSKKMWG